MPRTTDRASERRRDGTFPTAAPLALWSPGRRSVGRTFEARRQPAGLDIVACVHYRKTWIPDGEEFVDRRRIGLYVGGGSGRAVESRPPRAPRPGVSRSAGISLTSPTISGYAPVQVGKRVAGQAWWMCEAGRQVGG